MISLTDKTFNQKVSARANLVVVAFWARWSGAWHMMTPILEQLEVAFDGSIKIYKIDVDRNLRSKDDYGVRSTPTLLFFKQGAVVDRITGVVSRKELVDKLDSLLDET